MRRKIIRVCFGVVLFLAIGCFLLLLFPNNTAPDIQPTILPTVTPLPTYTPTPTIIQITVTPVTKVVIIPPTIQPLPTPVQYQAKVFVWSRQLQFMLSETTTALNAGDTSVLSRFLPDIETLQHDIDSTTPPIQYAPMHAHVSLSVAYMKQAFIAGNTGDFTQGSTFMQLTVAELDKAKEALPRQ